MPRPQPRPPLGSSGSSSDPMPVYPPSNPPSVQHSAAPSRTHPHQQQQQQQQHQHGHPHPTQHHHQPSAHQHPHPQQSQREQRHIRDVDLLPPRGAQKFGQYVIVKTLGEGSFGKVKLAVHQATGQRVALKIISRRKLVNKDMAGRVEREIQYLQLLRHPHIIKL